MSRLINADELKSKFLEIGCMDGKPCYGAEIIDRMPTVQAIPIEVLDKIRVEIETEYGHCDICEYFEDYDYEENDISEYRLIGNIADILQIIDKYKAESEIERW